MDSLARKDRGGFTIMLARSLSIAAPQAQITETDEGPRLIRRELRDAANSAIASGMRPSSTSFCAFAKRFCRSVDKALSSLTENNG